MTIYSSFRDGASPIAMTSGISGSGKGGGGHKPQETPDNLFSTQTAHVLDLLSEGEIEGIVGATDTEKLKNIFYNEVPIHNANGTPNFTGVTVYGNYGKPDQSAIPGFDNVSTTIQVSQDLPFDVYKTISFPNDGSFTAVTATIATDAFFEVNSDGDQVGTNCSFVIEVSENGGSFGNAHSGDITGKQTDGFSLDYRITLTDPSGITAIRIKRTKAANNSLKINDRIKFASYTKIVEHTLYYPNMAVVGHILDAKQFGNQIASRQYRVRGIKCRIPHNYNPVTRTYTGPFNGTLTTEKYWTNCGPWVLHEIVTNKRFGLGQFMDESYLDIPTLYQTAKFADEMVSNGKGGQEPRWSINTVINTRGDAFNVIKELVSNFRASLYWMEMRLWAIGDEPRDPVKIVTNANVIGGAFTRTGESDSQRVSVVNVSWNDPDIFMRRAIETVDNPKLVRELGYKTKDFGAFGCTSRAQARRLGKAILFSQEFESDIISYRASYDHMAVDGGGADGIAPGDVIIICDRSSGDALAGGRIVHTGGSVLTVEGENNITFEGNDLTIGGVDLTVGAQPEPAPNPAIMVGSSEAGGLLTPPDNATISFEGDTLTLGGAPVTVGPVPPLIAGVGSVFIEHSSDGSIEFLTCTYSGRTITLTQVPVQPVAPNDQYILLANGYTPETFIVLKISEDEPHILGVTAVRWDEDRMSAIYDDVTVDTTNYMGLPKTSVVLAPEGISTFERYITGVDEYSRVLDVNLTKSLDPYLVGYEVRYHFDNADWVTLPILGVPTATIKGVKQGVYKIEARALNQLGNYSLPVAATVVIGAIPNAGTLAIGDITGLALQSGGTIFDGADAKVKWTVITPQSEFAAAAGLANAADTHGISDGKFKDCIVTVRRQSDGSILRTESVIDTNYVYTFEKNFEDSGGAPVRALDIGVQYRDMYGRMSPERQLSISNPAPVIAAPVVTPNLDSIGIKLVKPVDTDYSLVKVYTNLSAGGVTAVPGDLAYTGPDTIISVPGKGIGVHSVLLVPYDLFGAGTPTAILTTTPTVVAPKLIKFSNEGKVSDPTFYNTQALIGVRNFTSLSPTYTVNASDVTISLPAHTRKIAGPNGPITLSYGAMSAVWPFSSYWTAYLDDPDLQGNPSPSVIFTSNPDDLLYLSRYQVASGMTPNSAGTGGATTTGGGTAPRFEACVDANSWMADDRLAFEYAQGDLIRIIDETTWSQSAHTNVNANKIVNEVPCVRLTSRSGITVVVSMTTPCTLLGGNVIAASHALGSVLAVEDAQGFRWEVITDVEDVGLRAVAHISANNGTYAAGEQYGRFIYTHNIYYKP